MKKIKNKGKVWAFLSNHNPKSKNKTKGMAMEKPKTEPKERALKKLNFSFILSLMAMGYSSSIKNDYQRRKNKSLNKTHQNFYSQKRERSNISHQKRNNN